LTREAGNLGEFVPPEFDEALAETPDPAPEPGPHPPPDPAPQPGPAPSPPVPEPQQVPQPTESAAPSWPHAVQPAVSTPRPPEAAPQPAGPATERRGAGVPRANAARLVAIQMAAAGSTRAEVESHIGGALGLAHPSPILDEIFGKGAPPDATVSWARPASR
jgi:outer membrane biosynthesis protein TonB